MMRQLTAVLITIWFASDSLAFEDGQIDFNGQIRPLLNRYCISCHGPDEEDRQADLRLDTFTGATEYAIVPGDPDGSDFIDRITSDDDELRMPPNGHGDRVKPDEIKLLRQWIANGAKFEKHWSFSSIRDPDVPKVDTGRSTNLRHFNSIDNFILRKLEDTGLNQNPPAHPESLVRRVSLDLTGLPPGYHESSVQQSIERFLETPSQDHFGQLVDCLIATPAFAEHWAAVWLDIARYADTCGYSGDEQRDIWPWRDWLIQSIESGKSYKQLSIEMLAGDMLPDATIDQQLATAFHRNTLANNEGGTNDEEFRTIAVKDRLSTTLNGWMGLTVRCAECHSHKYDPISQQEYYQLLDFFNQTVDADNRDDRPKLEVQASRDPKESATLDTRISKLLQEAESLPQVWKPLRPVKTRSREGTEFEILEDDSVLATGPLPGTEEYEFTFEVPTGTNISAIRLEALPHIRHDGNVGRAPEGSFILSQIRFAKLEQSESGESKEVILPFAAAANDYNQVNHHARTAILPTVESGGRQGWAVNHPVSGYRARHEAIFELEEPFVAESTTRFKIYLLHDPPWQRLNLGCVRISTCEVEQAASKYEKKELDPINREIVALTTKRDEPIRVPVIQERKPGQRRTTHVMIRGNFQSKGQKVTADYPEAFSVKNEYPTNRLGLARWLFDETNPLTARVAVNRYWARIMGTGLVETEEDFGTQGATPSHPDLLDHLATEFRRNDWNTRKLLKKIVTSATYQQSQTVSKKMLEIDPRNRLYSRGPRVRLSAEVIRDQALAVSGLLSKKRYGKPVYPPNPIKRVVNAFTGGMTWQESTGEDRYRRAIYTFLKRSAPHPLFDTFDVASRDVCNLRRIRTNTPLQSFMTLNDITFIEAAGALAEQAMQELSGEQPTEQMIIQILETALYESPDPKKVEVLSNLYRQCQNQFAGDLAAAAQMTGKDSTEFNLDLLDNEERKSLICHATLTVIANVVLNLDSFLNN